MPLTKPECLDCSYNLRGTRFGEQCPECGGVERKLLFDGCSRVMKWCIVIMGGVLVLSVVGMMVSWAHVYVFPMIRAEWLRQTTRVMRIVLLPSLVLGTIGGLVMSYGVVVFAALQHELNRAKLIQLCVVLVGCVLAFGCAWVWSGF